MKKLLTIFALFLTFSVFSQGEFSHKAWNNYLKKHPVSIKKDSIKTYKISLPTTGSGLIIYGTPSVVTTFLTIPFSNGVFQSPDGSVQPGLQYTVELAHYNVNSIGVPLTNYFGIGGFAVAGGLGSSTSPKLKGSVIGGIAVNISSYITIGYGEDFINKTGSLVIGGKFDLSNIEQGFLGSIFWHN